MTRVYQHLLVWGLTVFSAVAGASTTADESADSANGTGGAALWKMADEDTTVYLYGTLHSTKPGRVWFRENAANALATSDILYLELERNTPPAVAQRVRKRLYYNPEGESLSDYLSEDDESLLREAALRHGVSLTALERMKPWRAAFTLGNASLTRKGVDVVTGVEAHLLKEAARSGMPVRRFASFAEQTGYMADLPVDVQVRFLLYSLNEERENPDQFEALYEAWITGNVNELESIFGDAPDAIPEVYEALVVKRNTLWADEIERVMQQEAGTIFVAVGVGHLVGPDRLQSMLSKRGYTITRQ